MRLYSLYILGTLIGAAVALATILTGIKSSQTGFEWSGMRLAAAFFSALIVGPSPPIPGSHGSLYPLNAFAWSLAFEIVINLLYAFVFSYLRMRSLVLLILSSAAGLIFASLYFDSLDLGLNWENWIGGVFRIGYSFFAGVLLCRLYRARHLEIPSNFSHSCAAHDRCHVHCGP